MRKLLLITLIIMLTQVAGAQKIHFTDTSNVWEELISIYNDGQGGILFDTYHYIEDVTIDTTVYRKFNFGPLNNYSLIREDTVANKVYIRDEYNDSDVVLMDYNLNAGDTFTIVYNDTFNHHRFAVLGLDSVLINATWHKVWTFSENLDAFFPFDNSIVIEGIGCIRHPMYLLLHSNCVECSYYYMYCFSNNGITPPVSPGQPYLQWSNVLFDNDTSCTEVPALNIDDLQYHRAHAELYPNPSNTSVNIKSPSNITSLTISNMIGQVVYSRKYNSKPVQVDITTLPQGMYLVRINNAEVAKFMKQ